MGNVNLTVKPAWISTVDHLARFREVAGKRSLMTALFLGYLIPPDFPMVRVGRRWAPLVYIASGVFYVGPARIRFDPSEATVGVGERRNIRADVILDFAASEVVAVERFRGKQGRRRYFDLPFISVRTKSTGPMNEFLICPGGVGPSMRKIRKRSDELLRALELLIGSKA